MKVEFLFLQFTGMYNTLIFLDNVSGHKDILEAHVSGFWFQNDKVKDIQMLFMFHMEMILFYPSNPKRKPIK